MFDEILGKEKRSWLVTGAAGFIGSNLVEVLLNHGDIRNLSECERACAGIEYVLHQAALGSVPRSIEEPINTHESNIDGFLNILVAARDANVKQFVYASSSSVYGDHPGSPKVEEVVGTLLSPYALSKSINEQYAAVFSQCYNFNTIGLRYFNVFGKRQDPEGAYAAVIPRWIMALLTDNTVEVYGDGETTRDFTYINNVIQANLRAALSDNTEAFNQVYNVAVGEKMSLNELFSTIKDLLSNRFPDQKYGEPRYCDFRPGDIRHSLASISKITK